MKLEIAGRYKNKKSIYEEKFYTKLLGRKSFKFIPFRIKRNLYNLSDKYAVIVSTHSTFGFESLARGNRTVIFNNKSKFLNGKFDVFWFTNFKKKGLFWTNEVSFKEVSRVLNFAIFSNNFIWKKKLIIKLKNYYTMNLKIEI